jgi:hypothetical protein
VNIVRQGEYGLVVVKDKDSPAFCGDVGYYGGDDIDDNEFPGAIVYLGSPFNHDYIIFEYSDLRHAMASECQKYMEIHSKDIQKNADILRHLGVVK